MPELDVEALEIRLFLEAIHQRYGYDLRDYSPASVRRRANAALAHSGLASFGELQHRVLKDPQLFAQVIEDLTVRVSEMFRDPSFFAAFRKNVVPVLQTYPLLRIWHAGCATGEEVYASAILLSEVGLYDRAQIYATDLSPTALDLAKQGVYSAERRKVFAENYTASGGQRQFSDYCTEAYGGIALKESLRRNVLFFQHDLVSDHVFAEMHVIFCRNVLIYFGRDLKERVIAKLAQSLCPGGFFCLGTSERLGSAHPFVAFSDEERIYRHEH